MEQARNQLNGEPKSHAPKQGGVQRLPKFVRLYVNYLHQIGPMLVFSVQANTSLLVVQARVKRNSASSVWRTCKTGGLPASGVICDNCCMIVRHDNAEVLCTGPSSKLQLHEPCPIMCASCCLL